MSLSVDVIDKLAALITAAFGLVAALAWNTAIQAVFTEIFGTQSSIPAMLGYAVFVTIIAVFFTVWIGFVSGKAKDKIPCNPLHKKE
ncbi:MAG: DUF5654 family protein [Methanocorpusculum sp.]|nr:DUF5654 family protein [Methanocorpusculum sp.]